MSLQTDDPAWFVTMYVKVATIHNDAAVNATQ